MDRFITDNRRREIRPFQYADEADTAAVWYRSGLAAYPYLPTWQAMTLETAQWVFHNVIRAQCSLWVGTLDARVVAFLAMNRSYLDRLYIDPCEWRKGWGTRIVDLARQLSPSGLELHKDQENHAGCALFEMSDKEILAKLLELNLERCKPALPSIRIESSSTIVEERAFHTGFLFRLIPRIQ